MSKKEDKRQMIIEKSIELFSENGYHKTKVEDITKALDISKGNFYTYFDSKEEVLYEILEKIKEEKIKALKEIDINRNPKEVLKEFVNKRSNIFFKYMKKTNVQNVDTFLKDQKIVNYVNEIQIISVNFIEENIINRGGGGKKYNSRFISEFVLLSIEGFFLDEVLSEGMECERGYSMEREKKIEQIIEFINNALK